jgi:hypothetical protein
MTSGLVWSYRRYGNYLDDWDARIIRVIRDNDTRSDFSGF